MVAVNSYLFYVSTGSIMTVMAAGYKTPASLNVSNLKQIKLNREGALLRLKSTLLNQQRLYRGVLLIHK